MIVDDAAEPARPTAERMDDRGRGARPVALDEQAGELRELGRGEQLVDLGPLVDLAAHRADERGLREHAGERDRAIDRHGLDKAARELGAKREARELSPRLAVRREQLAFACAQLRGAVERRGSARELALQDDQLAALATDRSGPHEARGVVIGMLPTICDQPGEAIHAAASIATTARLGCCTRAAPRTRADMPAALRRGRRIPRAPESRRGCPTAALGAPRGPS